MGSQTLFSLFSLFLVLAFSVCHGALTFQEYWNLMLPNTLMPAAIRDHLGEPAAGVVTGVDGKPVKVDLGAKPLLHYDYHTTGDAGTVTGVDGEPVKVDLGAKPLLHYDYHTTGDAGTVTGVDGEPVKVDLGVKFPFFYNNYNTGDVGTVIGVDGEPVKVDLGAKPIFHYNYHTTGDAGTVTGVDGEPVKVDLGAKPILHYDYHTTGDAGTVTGVDGEPGKSGTKPILLHNSYPGTENDAESNPMSLYSRKLSFGTSTRPNHHNPAVIYNSTAQNGRVDHPKAPGFFLERDLHVGAQMNASFDRGLTGDRFLHREVAETIPFSSNELRDILRRFAVQSGSALANKFENTIRMCEMAPTPSEKKHCATSLESMVEFVISALGTKDLQTLTTAIRKDAPTQVYTMQSWTVVPTPDWMTTVCHVQKYSYTVFNCHGIPQTKPYVVKMVGEDGTQVDAAVLCHKDTSEWPATFYALQLLKVRPGETTVCHLLPDGDVVWFPRSAIKTAM